jgi:hypothetical protein
LADYRQSGKRPIADSAILSLAAWSALPFAANDYLRKFFLQVCYNLRDN